MERISVSKVYIFLACMFGCLFILLVPPFQTPDEDSHFKRAYVISEGKFFPEVEDGRAGYYFSREICEYIDKNQSNIGKLDSKYTFSEIISKEQQPAVYNDKEFVQFATMNTVWIGHIIPAFGICVGKLVSVLAGREPSVLFLLYFARAANLLFYVACVSLSIRLTPILKRTFCMIGLMPMALYIACSPSYDTLLLGATFVFSALTFHLLLDPDAKLKGKHLLLYSIIAFIYVILKIVYIPLFALLLFLPKKQYKKWEFLKKVGIFIALFVGIYFLMKLPTFFIESVSAGTNPRMSEQIQYVLKHPKAYLHIFYTTVKQLRGYYVASTIGLFGLVDTRMPDVFIYAYLFFAILFGAVEVNEKEGLPVKWYHQVVVLFAVMAGVFGIYLAMYLFWTSVAPGGGVGVPWIDGVQGRYFIPFIPMLYLVFYNRHISRMLGKRKIGQAVSDYGYMVSAVMLTISEVIVLLRFWV